MSKDSLKSVTAWFIITIIVVIGVFDVWVFSQGGTEVTISHTIFTWSHAFPAFTFAMGFVCGHLFWRIRPVKKEENDNSES